MAGDGDAAVQAASVVSVAQPAGTAATGRERWANCGGLAFVPRQGVLCVRTPEDADTSQVCVNAGNNDPGSRHQSLLEGTLRVWSTLIIG